MGLFIPRLVTSQPQGPADPLLSGIGDGLSGVWIPYTVAAPVNLVSGRPPAAIATAASASAGKVGGAFVTTWGGGEGYAYDNELLYPTDAVSVLALFETTGTVANNLRIAGSIHPTVSPFKGFGLDFSSSTNVRFNVSGSTFTSINGAFVGNLSLVVGTYDRATMRLFVNGSQVASTAKTEAIQYNGTSFGLFRFTTALTTFHTEQGFPGKTYLVGMWRRALTLGEIQALTVNPWQIFRPYTARIYSFPSGAGNNYTLTGAVTHTLTPAATFSINRAYSLAGAVSYTLTPSATLAINRAYSLTGAASFTLTPSAAFDIDRAYALSGAVTPSLSPAATMTYTAAGSAAITGAVTYTLTPSAAFAINRAYTLTGAVTHTLSVAAAMQYTAQQAIEFVIQGGHYFPRVTVNDWRERSAKQRREYLERLLGLAEELPEAVEEEVEALIEAQGVETPAQVVRLDVVRVNRLIAQIEQIIEDEDETLFLLMAS